MIRSFLTVSSGTLASRLLGFVRDSMIAALLGATPIADAFLFAFQFVNVVRRSMSEGGLNAALIPAWLRIREAGGAAAAAAFAGRVLGTVSLVLMAMVALIGLGLPPLVAALAPHLAGDPSVQFTIENTRLMLPYLAFAGPATVMMALLNAQDRFALTAFLPLLFNIALIAVMIVLLVQRQEAGLATRVLAATVGVAGLLQLAVVALRRGGDLATPVRAAFDAEMRGFFGKAVPGMIASSAPQLLIVAGAIIASSSPSSVSWLYFANRLVELPLGIVGVAMGSVLIPQMTRALRGGDAIAVANAESRGLELAAGLALPATLGLILLSEPVVKMLFEHGAFTASDTAATAQTLMWLALSLPANVLVKALSPAFFAREDTLDAAGRDTEGRGVRARAGDPARSLVRRQRHCRRHRARRLEHRTDLDPQGRRNFRVLDRCRRPAAAARHPRRRAGHGRRLVAGDAVGARAGPGLAWPFAGGAPVHPDYRRNYDLRPVFAAFRHHRLARSG